MEFWEQGFLIFQNCISHQTDVILGTKLFSIFFELAIPSKLMEFREPFFTFQTCIIYQTDVVLGTRIFLFFKITLHTKLM